jgi:quaternary ammonium compound-resistance protein SugE
MTLAWIYLFIAGLLEIVWATALKMSDGFSRPIPAIITALGAFASFWFLARAMQALPMGTAYAIWVGIGAVGVAILGMVWFAEPANAMRLGGIALIVIGIIALKLA